MREKGFIRDRSRLNSGNSNNLGPDKKANQRGSETSPIARPLGEAHLPGEVTNPEEQLY